MKTVSLSGSLRENVGSKDAKHLRLEARVPGVIYGNGQNIHFHVKETELNKLVFTPDVNFVGIDLDGKEYKAIFKEIQFHPVTDRITHFDLLAITEDKIIDIALPVRLTGNSPGVLNGGKLRQNYRKLKVKALAKDLPEFIELDIAELKIGMSIRLGEIEIPNVTLVGDMRDVAVSVKTSRNAVADELEAADAAGAEGATEGAEGAAEEASAE
ncbi:50S ribosomal protein L25 [Flavobacteriales bacterium]|jgi:large subunit ribosomal protein L25|nr:50S ribosomal protein L25 [Flavobacteriales bacterium]|tara:strand:+ start:1173 stop:1811 length:639 start_codon:yes stop_codon:yes gene_type:complete